MDQLKPILDGIRTHRFWVISGAVLLAYLTTWFLTTSRLRTETIKREKELDGLFSAASRIQGEPLHPNKFSETGMDLLIDRYIDEVSGAWKEQYDAQVSSLVWADVWERDFLSTVRKLRPIETMVAANLPPREEPLTLDQRNRYRFFAKDELPKLAEIVGAHWGPAGPAERDQNILVDWKKANQTNLQDTRFSWANSTPTTLEVLYAQEDLWVLTALLNIIKDVNGDIKGKYQAAVKEIDFIDIGPDAIGVSGAVSSLDGGSGGGGSADGGYGSGMDGGLKGGSGDMASTGALSGPGGGDDSGQEVVRADPAENRYVDKEFKPLSAERLRAAYDSTNPDDAILAVAKRMPVRLRLKMDQRKINRLLAAFANYKLQVEIRQVRINCKSGSTFRGAGLRSGGGGGASGGMGIPGMDGGMGMGMGMDGGMGMGGYGSGDEGFGGAAGIEGGGGYGDMDGGAGIGGPAGLGGGLGAGQPKLKDVTPWDLDVELYGIIHLYNPVDRDKIGKKLAPVTGDGLPAQAGG